MEVQLAREFQVGVRKRGDPGLLETAQLHVLVDVGYVLGREGLHDVEPHVGLKTGAIEHFPKHIKTEHTSRASYRSTFSTPYNQRTSYS